MLMVTNVAKMNFNSEKGNDWCPLGFHFKFNGDCEVDEIVHCLPHLLSISYDRQISLVFER